MDEAIFDRGLGCLLGLAIGDALGTTLEFTVRDAHPAITGLIGGGPFELESGQWTDDTSMALCLADSLLFCDGFDARDLMNRFLNWYECGHNSATGTCFDIGSTTREALERYRATGDPFAGSDDPRSAGNGSIMRLAPVALRWHHDIAAARTVARDQSRTTHASDEPIEGAMLLVSILVDSIVCGDKLLTLRPRSSKAPGIDAVAEGSWRHKQRDDIRSSGYVVHTLEAALWCVDRAGSFDEAVLLAANLGDDADSVAAVTGQIAGALWGLSSIPSDWVDNVAWSAAILERGRRLLNA
ncbi:MAG TPA: ADP-ribosylglycohydrolase family protein [Candidatus Acidoferrum sp.]|nr:ADP-ribosylglycohydrolase family protein [Candidatus Acidoferrum sp.]